MRIFGISIGFSSFIFFLAKSFRWGCLACKLVPKIRGCPNGFWYISFDVLSIGFPFCFVVSLSFRFSKLVHYFLFDLDGSFWMTFGFGFIGVPWSFFNLLTCDILIFSGGLRLISSEVIAPIPFLKSWTLITFIMTFRFLLNFCMFLLEAIGVRSSMPLPFHMHLKLVGKLIPLRAITCVPFFE